MFKSKRPGICLSVLFLLLAAMLGAGGYIKTQYTIRTVYVEGNVHYTEEEIKSIVMNGFLGDNSLYLSWKYKDRGIEGIPFVDVVDVDILAPDTVKIIVYEKTLTGYIRYLDTCVYFDKDGYVVECSGVKTVGVPQVLGLQFSHVVVGEMLPVEDEKIFNEILNITRLLKKYDLTADEIVLNPSGSLVIYFGDVEVALGNESGVLEDKLMLLPQLLAELEGKSGVLQMQTFDEEGGKYVFKPKV